MFSDIRVPRYDSNGDKIDDFIVPIEFGNKDKAYQLSKHDIENLHSGNVNSFPRMALSFDSMNKQQQRDTNKLAKLNKRKNPTDPDALMYEYQHNGRAYDFNFTIFLATRTATDAFIIIEQIAPMFRPDISLKIQELDNQSKPTTVPVELGDFSVILPEDMAEDEIRIIETDFPLILKGTLYLPIKDQGVIDQLEVNMHIVEAERAAASQKYGIDTIEEITSLVSQTTTFTPGGEVPESVEEIPAAQDATDILIQHYDNSKPTP